MTDDELPIGASPVEIAVLLRQWLDKGITYARKRRQQFRRAASITQVVTLTLTASSTVILGLQDLDFWTGLGFSLVAVATVVGALEPFFNWRARWVLMEEMQAGFHRLKDEVDYYLANKQADKVESEDLDEFYRRYRDIWMSTSDRWLEFRRTAGSSQGHQAGPR